MSRTKADLYEFQWPVDQDGYFLDHVDDDRPKGGGVLTAGLTGDFIRRRGGPLRYYRPMEAHPGLWRRFAETCISVEGVLSFVNDFGLLAASGKAEGHDYERPERILETATLIRHIAAELDSGERRSAVALFSLHAKPQLTAGIRRDERKEIYEFKLIPRTLRGALLLQAGEAITGNRRFRRCKNCSEWFVLGPGGHTARRQFCRDRCRVAWARHHKQGRIVDA